VRLHLNRRDRGEPILVEVTKEEYQALGLKEGEQAFVRPRAVRVFVDDRSI